MDNRNFPTNEKTGAMYRVMTHGAPASSVCTKAREMLTMRASTYKRCPDFGLNVPAIEKAVAYVTHAHVGDHPFFAAAATEPRALHLWAEQEFLTSANFSQILSIWLSTIDNFHIRTLVIPVLAGEHNRLSSQGLAQECHPNLAANLCSSLGTNFDNLRPVDATVTFIAEMESCASSPMRGAGYLGVGNERLLVPEYTAVRQVFREALPASNYESFLSANIDEDTWHSALIERAAAGLVSLGHNPQEFLDGAVAGVDGRLRYYDSLLDIVRDGRRLKKSLSV